MFEIIAEFYKYYINKQMILNLNSKYNSHLALRIMKIFI